MVAMITVCVSRANADKASVVGPGMVSARLKNLLSSSQQKYGVLNISGGHSASQITKYGILIQEMIRETDRSKFHDPLGLKTSTLRMQAIHLQFETD